MKIKFGSVVLGTLATSVALAAVPTVSNVEIGGGKTARITYDLTGDPGIVTMEIQTNTVADLSGTWVPIDGQLLRGVSGDVSCLVQPGRRRVITWPVKDVLGEGILPNARAVLTAWATNAPPDWCVGDLSGKDVPRYYTSTNYFPYGSGHLTYKTTNIVYKLVKAEGRTFTAGEYSYVDTNAGKNPHVVTLTRDYYLTIYEATQAQYHWATGQQRPYQNDDWPAGMNYERIYPVNMLWRANARGSEQWPTDGCAVSSKACFVGGARDKSKLFIDLPTEAEWEFAARCGGYRGVNSQIVNGEVAPYREVANVKAYDSTGTYGRLLPVGSLKANDWGFYDMVGNVAEMCLDWVFQTSNKPAGITEKTVDPIGLMSGGSAYVFRGSGYRADYGCNTTGRSTYGQGQIGYGFRTVVVIEPHRFASGN